MDPRPSRACVAACSRPETTAARGLAFARVKRFLASGRSGFYFAVDEEGDLAAGDAVEPLERATHEVTVSEITRLYAHDRNDLDALRRAAEVGALPESWREFFRQQVEKLST